MPVTTRQFGHEHIAMWHSHFPSSFISLQRRGENGARLHGGWITGLPIERFGPEPRHLLSGQQLAVLTIFTPIVRIASLCPLMTVLRGQALLFTRGLCLLLNSCAHFVILAISHLGSTSPVTARWASSITVRLDIYREGFH